MTFVLIVRLSFFVLHETDQVLKGRLKWYEKSAKRKVKYKRTFRLEPLKWNCYGLQIGNFWIHYEYGIVWILNPEIYIFFFPWRNKIQPSSLLWILYLILQPRSQVFSHALNSTLTCLYDACSVTNVPRGVLGARVNPDTCGQANSIWKWIRMDVGIFEPGNKCCGFINTRIRVEGGWMNDWMACFPVSRF